MQRRRQFLAGCMSAALLLWSMPLATAAELPRVALQTSMGRIVLELYPEQAPKSVENFLRYVKAGRYENTIFHRVIEGFMIQGGGFDRDMQQQEGFAPIPNEAANGLKNRRYTVAMARTAAPHSASSQFFINVSDNASLDYPKPDGWGYAVFGQVVEGKQVVDRIQRVATTSRGFFQDVPIKPVVIEAATIVQ